MSRWYEKFKNKKPLTDAELLELIEMPMESEDEYENDSDDEWEPNRDDYLDNSQDHEDSVTGSNVDDTTADDDISEGPEDLNDQTTSATTSRKNTNTR